MRRQHVQLRDRKSYGARPAFWSLHGLARERPPACLGDLYARDLDRTSAGDHALGLCGRMSDAYQLNHLLDRKAMRDQDRFRASIGAGRKQLERAPAAAVGFGTMLAALLGYCGHLDRRPMHRRQGRTVRHELVYFCSEHIENAEASPARAWLLVHDINSELHPLAVDVQSFDRSAFRDAIKVVRECGSCVISARQLHMPRRFDGHRGCRLHKSSKRPGGWF